MDDEETSSVVEWVIENFGCFCQELHGDIIESPVFNFSSRFFLTPEGPKGHMEVEIKRMSSTKKPRANPGVLTFQGSDRYPLHTQPMDDSNLLDPPPTFQKVVAYIREREPSCPDQLIIRYKFPSKKSFSEYMCTALEVVETDFGVDVDVTKGSVRIADIDYTHCRKFPSRLHLSTVRRGKDLELTLEPSNFKRFCLVQCYMNVAETGGGWKMKENLFRDEETPWTIYDFQDIGKVKKISMLLRLKIVTGTFATKYFRRMTDYRVSTSLQNLSDSSLNNTTCSEAEVSTSSALESHYDIFLRCGSVTFATHRYILSAWSPVFERLLASDMREAASGEVEISDLDPPTLARFLAFLDTATVEDLTPETAMKLYYAADKYDVKTLKKECSDYLVKNVAIPNVCDILSLGTKHLVDELVDVAQNFILNNFNAVLASKEWQAFKSVEPLLAVNTITSFAERNCLGKINPSV